MVIQNFLEAYGNYFDRVMVNDVFDTIFQKDPFIRGIPKSAVAVSIERVQFGSHNTNMMWVKSVDDQFEWSWWEQKWVINSGFEIGQTDLVLDLFHAMNQPKFFYAKNTLDQGALNVLHYRGAWNNLWVDYSGENFVSASYSIFELKPDKNGFVHEREYPDKTPAVIHQFDRICPVVKNLKKICPVMGPWHRYPGGRPGYFMQGCGGYSSINSPVTLL